MAAAALARAKEYELGKVAQKYLADFSSLLKIISFHRFKLLEHKKRNIISK